MWLVVNCINACKKTLKGLQGRSTKSAITQVVFFVSRIVLSWEHPFRFYIPNAALRAVISSKVLRCYFQKRLDIYQGVSKVF